MSVTFASVTLPIPQVQSEDIQVLTRETVLLSGKLSVQTSTHYGRSFTFSCVGTSSQYDALIGVIGTKGALVINGSSYANFCIQSFGPITKNTMTNLFSFNIGLVQDTSI